MRCLNCIEYTVFDFIHIDGYAKNKEQLKRNLKNWYKKVKPGGIFSGHDMQYPKVEQIIRQFAEEKKLTVRLSFFLTSNNVLFLFI